MSLTSPLKRRVLARQSASLLVVSVALSLGACSGGESAEKSSESASAETRTVKTEKGQVKVPADPQAIVVLNPALTGYVYAVGDSVAAATATNTDSTDFPAMYADRAKEDGTEVVDWSNDGFDLESIELLEPDLILAGGPGFPGTQALDVYDDLTEIAPTVIAPRDATTWNAELEFVGGDLLGHDDDVKSLISDYEDRAAEVAKSIDPPKAPIGYMLLQADGKPWSIPEGAALPTLMADAGLEPYPLTKENSDLEAFGSGDSVEVPSERISDVFVAPSMFVTGFQVDNVDLDKLKQDPVIGKLPALENDAAYELPEWSHRPDYFGAMKLLDEVEQQFG
ncbi:MAG: ABC transporter substrate-binding protein [Brevibacterium aurantiacum]|uniref:ABC transporter substrate-binding protein n=1 Tax=Brevibacterium aurantiacum TaxID=273384 RepID=UPI003F9071F5